MFYISSLKYKLPRLKDHTYAYRIDGTMTAKYKGGGGSIPVNLGERSLSLASARKPPIANFGFAEFVSDNDLACYLYIKDEKVYSDRPRIEFLQLAWLGADVFSFILFQICSPERAANTGVWLEKDVSKQAITYSEVHACVRLFHSINESSTNTEVITRILFPDPIGNGTEYQIKIILDGKEYTDDKPHKQEKSIVFNTDGKKSIVFNTDDKKSIVFHTEIPLADINKGYDKRNKISIYIKNLTSTGKYPDWTPIKIRLAHKTDLKDAEEIIFLPAIDMTAEFKDFSRGGLFNSYTIKLYEPEHEY